MNRRNIDGCLFVPVREAQILKARGNPLLGRVEEVNNNRKWLLNDGLQMTCV